MVWKYLHPPGQLGSKKREIATLLCNFPFCILGFRTFSDIVPDAYFFRLVV